jgi:PAS domain S-box-containing protein
VEELPLYAAAIGGQRAVVVDDCVTNPRVPRAWRAALDSRAILVVPLIRRREVMGVVALHDTRQPRNWDEHELKLATAIASEVALAIDNARVYDDVFTQRACLAQIFDSTSDGIVLVSEAGRIVSANRRAGEFLGFDPAAVAGVALLDVLAGHYAPGPASERAAAPFQALLRRPAHGGHGDLELSRTRAIVQWTASPTRNAAGAVVGLTLTLHDVTGEREISRMKSDFISFVTHQLRTPLAGIKWLLELAGRTSLPEEARGYVEDSRSSAERLGRLVSALVDVSRLENGTVATKPEAVSLHEVTCRVLEDLSALLEEKGHRVHLRGMDALPLVIADPQLLRQVVFNLISNAINYTPPAGDISIRGHRHGAAITWSIEDSGIGIPRSSQARLFEKFHRGENAMTIEPEGAGLGLYLARLIVEQWGGTVTCESDAGEGATFTVSFPAPEPRP